ncbi:hypothetical protein [Limobrevibacterium gyesilva]|uniref:YXWGXW repeat-containing protein n=1 Tax=Limobrevibacterium gyesilva TaxID=2991712 RepID=A0AA41YLD0_9PROT|nr:hypothetical protein [Limobrevibacterium gyesilva]MCW3475941.1 hypothetical protein [Limobrevibacterium gyesilva]
MPRFLGACLALPALVGLTACEPAPQPPQVVVSPTSPAPIVVPGPPPAAQAELVPPPPSGSGPVVWQPGHWAWIGQSGAPWQWMPGRYVQTPMGHTAWVQGQWVQNASGGWSWVEGHWM